MLKRDLLVDVQRGHCVLEPRPEISDGQEIQNHDGNGSEEKLQGQDESPHAMRRNHNGTRDLATEGRQHAQAQASAAKAVGKRKDSQSGASEAPCSDDGGAIGCGGKQAETLATATAAAQAQAAAVQAAAQADAQAAEAMAVKAS